MNVTLDTNCIIALEQREAAAPHVQGLLSDHRAGLIALRVVATMASEVMPGGRTAPTFKVFKNRLAELGADDIEILKPIGYYDMAYWDWTIWGDEAHFALADDIHRILFPSIELSYADFCKTRGIDPAHRPNDRKWRNAKCDVLTLWGHIHYGGGIFVTDDGKFHTATKKPRLLALGAGEILRPHEARAAVHATHD